MESSKPEEKKQESSQSTSTTTGEKTLSQIFKEMPYSDRKVGQGFVMSWRKPPEGMKNSSEKSEGKSDKK